ncbi:NAD(P)-dependent oxidoreductase [Acidicapsa dinghuensis]|uniref:NAD(P)-dependent oxidoreductase n=1 Tax=Acidicapsa dinghuensis TaxID=2218256 RepID=A0ABW1EEV6_9BACT|nr:SDR family oxidoreductase [Acidicapsa dinghuensis]
MVATDRRSMRLLILGATGGVGQEIVNEALKRRHRVTAFVRSPEKLGASQDDLTVVEGSVCNVDAMAAAFTGHDAVLSAIGSRGLGPSTITGDSARATVTAMRTAGIHRLVIVGVAMLFKESGLLGSILRNTLLRNVAIDSVQMERVVTASALDWTIVRPPRLTNGARTERYGVADNHLPSGSGVNATVSRADVAHFMLDEVEQPRHMRRVVGIAYTKRAHA